MKHVCRLLNEEENVWENEFKRPGARSVSMRSGNGWWSVVMVIGHDLSHREIGENCKKMRTSAIISFCRWSNYKSVALLSSVVLYNMHLTYGYVLGFTQKLKFALFFITKSNAWLFLSLSWIIVMLVIYCIHWFYALKEV